MSGLRLVRPKAAVGRARGASPLEAPPGFEPGVKVLQTSALPLGYAAVFFILERETGFEPATSTLARLHSTTELLPR